MEVARVHEVKHNQVEKRVHELEARLHAHETTALTQGTPGWDASVFETVLRRRFELALVEMETRVLETVRTETHGAVERLQKRQEELEGKLHSTREGQERVSQVTAQLSRDMVGVMGGVKGTEARVQMLERKVDDVVTTGVKTQREFAKVDEEWARRLEVLQRDVKMVGDQVEQWTNWWGDQQKRGLRADTVGFLTRHSQVAEAQIHKLTSELEALSLNGKKLEEKVRSLKKLGLKTPETPQTEGSVVKAEVRSTETPKEADKMTRKKKEVAKKPPQEDSEDESETDTSEVITYRLVGRKKGNRPLSIPRTSRNTRAVGSTTGDTSTFAPSSHLLDPLTMELIKSTTKPVFSGNADDWDTFCDDWEEFWERSAGEREVPDSTKIRIFESCLDATNKRIPDCDPVPEIFFPLLEEELVHHHFLHVLPPLVPLPIRAHRNHSCLI